MRIITTPSALPRFNWDAETLPSNKPPICSGVSGRVPTVRAFAVAYAENPLAKSSKNEAIKLGKSNGIPIRNQ